MSVEPEWVFETTDYEGSPVVLSRATWHTKAGNDEPGTHPEIRGYLEEVQAAISSPDLVFQSTRDERSCIFYLLGAGRGDFAGKHLVIVVKYVEETPVRRTRLCEYDVPQPYCVFTRSASMVKNGERPLMITVDYDEQTDILTFAFTGAPQPAVAEEAADEVWVRYDPVTHRVITVEVLNVSVRVRAAFGSALTYTERTDPERLEALHGLPVSAGDRKGSLPLGSA